MMNSRAVFLLAFSAVLLVNVPETLSQDDARDHDRNRVITGTFFEGPRNGLRYPAIPERKLAQTAGQDFRRSEQGRQGTYSNVFREQGLDTKNFNDQRLGGRLFDGQVTEGLRGPDRALRYPMMPGGIIPSAGQWLESASQGGRLMDSHGFGKQRFEAPNSGGQRTGHILFDNQGAGLIGLGSQETGFSRFGSDAHDHSVFRGQPRELLTGGGRNFHPNDAVGQRLTPSVFRVKRASSSRVLKADGIVKRCISKQEYDELENKPHRSNDSSTEVSDVRLA